MSEVLDAPTETLQIGQESLIDAFDEAMVLWAQHWKETEQAYRASPMNPDYDQFKAIEAAGWSRYFTARLGGKLVGHLYFIVYPGRHTKTLSAVEDFYFFLPEHRKGMDALKLLRYATGCLKGEGCDQVGMSSKLTSNRDIDPLLRRAGYRHVANFYVI